MTRYLGVLARPMVRAFAALEVIACGLRGSDGRVAIIYSRASGRTRHQALMHDGRRWQPVESVELADFSAAVVRQVLIPHARPWRRYRMRAVNSRGWRISSPTITVKEATIYDPTLLTIAASSLGSVTFSWGMADACDPMIYFLAVEDAKGVNHAAIYTREISWTYPRTGAASLSVGPARPPQLVRGATHRAKLVLVDYEGWVSHIAERSFIA